MAKKKKNTADKQVTAVHILEAITHFPRLINLAPKKRTKTPAAGALGRPARPKGEKAGSKTLRSKRRAASAKNAARAQKKR